MKQAILQKNLCDYGMITHGRGGEKVIKQHYQLTDHAKRCLKAGEGINDIWEIYSMEETKDGKAWIVNYFTEEEFAKVINSED